MQKRLSFVKLFTKLRQGERSEERVGFVAAVFSVFDQKFN